ncbi:CPBP family intramembrane glutamic endopeptidase [Clostridium sporogenes]
MESKLSEKSFELSVLGALVIMIYGFIIIFLVSIPFEILLEIMYVNTHKSLELIVAILNDLIPKAVMLIFILKKVRKYYEYNFKIKYIEKFNFKLLLCTIFLALGFVLWCQSSIGIMIEKIPVSKFVEKLLEEKVQNPYSSVISSIIIAPIFEEILMRGIILEGFLNKYKPATAIIASALIFGLIHLNIPQFINATIAGLFLGIIYYKTRSLVLCIATHMLNNAIAFTDIRHNTISFFIGAIIFIISAILFQKYIIKLKYVDANSQKNSISSKG